MRAGLPLTSETLRGHVLEHWSSWLGEPAPSALDTVIFGRGAVRPVRSTVFVFVPEARMPRLVLKVGFEEESRFLAVEFRALQGVRSVASPRVLESIPTPLGLDPVGGAWVEAMSFLDGVQWRIPSFEGRRPIGGPRTLRRFLVRISEWSEALASCTSGPAPCDERPFGHLVSDFCEAFELERRAHARLRSFALAVERADLEWLPCWQHGDLTVGNVLFQGTAPRVIDWELAGFGHPPWFDLVYSWLALLLLHAHRTGGRPVGEALRELWSPGSWVESVGKDLFSARWTHPLPLPWALVLVSMTAAVRSASAGRAGADRWAALVRGMVVDDRIRAGIRSWAPEW